ncbi:hypothetical protein ACUM5Y_12315 [Marinomonas dokdonensis]|uniref:hypothetical protein n=1 Tax=Marinomonas dokdonensis TaxID=328224 RepID=UPI004055485C
MPKWLIWLLVEFNTVLLVASLLMAWLVRRQHANNQNTKNADEASKGQQSLEADNLQDSENYHGLVHYINQQISYAVAVLPTIKSPSQLNLFKIWGSLLQAERSILLNNQAEQPKPTLSRFLSSLLYAITSPKLQKVDSEELKKSLKLAEQEFTQTTEILISKEALQANQALLNEDLRKSIENTKTKVRRMGIKHTEYQRLKLELSELQKKIAKLNGQEVDTPELIKHNAAEYSKANKDKPASALQAASLASLTHRQKIVIDQLKNQIGDKEATPTDTEEAQRVALSRLERLSAESQMIVQQLEHELKDTDLSIQNLKKSISKKDQRLAELEKQLVEKNESAISSLQSINSDKRDALDSLQKGLSAALESAPNDALREQDKDSQMLERLLHESETCVELLAQELTTAEKANDELKAKLAESMGHQVPEGLQTQRTKNRELLQRITQLKEQDVQAITKDDHQALRVEYNKKNLEYDRLQLAFADLERKYLGVINQ